MKPTLHFPGSFNRLSFPLAALLIFGFGMHPVSASTWTNTSNGSWTNQLNWSPNSVPNAASAVADFSTLNMTNSATAAGNGKQVTLDGNQTVGAIYIDDPVTTDNATAQAFTNRPGLPANSVLTLQTTNGQPPIISISNVIASAGTLGMIDNQFLAQIASTNGFRKIGPGRMILTNNAITGTIFLDQGAMRLNAATTTNAFGFAQVRVANGAQAYLSPGTATITNDFFITGYGVAETTPGWFFGAIRFGAAGMKLTGKVTLTGNTRISSRSANSPFSTLAGQITESNGPCSLEFNFTGDSSSGEFVLSNNTANANNWSGDTLVSHSGNVSVRLAVNEQIPNGVGKGNLIITNSWPTIPSIFDVNGQTETINGLSSAGADPTRCIITNTTGTGNLIVGDNDASSTYAGSIRGALNLTKVGTGTLSLKGSLPLTGSLTVSNGTLALGFTSTISNGATLSMSNNAALTLSVSPTATNITIGTLTTAGSTNKINLLGVTGITSYPTQFTLVKFTTGISGAGNNFGIGTTPGSRTGGYISNDTSRLILVLTNGPQPLVWKGNDGVNPTFWDTTTTNWTGLGAVATAYNQVDLVTFDDTASTNKVNLQTALTPGSVTVTNTTGYTFFGSGTIGGDVCSLTKLGSGTLTMLESGDSFQNGMTINGGTVVLGGDNTIAGGVTIASGATLQVGTNGTTGTLPSGNIANDGTLIFNRGADLIASQFISGNGSLIKTNAGVLTLGGNNSFTGTVTVANGTLKIGNSSALGGVTNLWGTTVASGATLDVNGFNINQELILVSGMGVNSNGAVINSGADVFPSIARMTLTGDTSFGGTGRWDLRSVTASDPSGASLGGAFNLIKTGSNFIALSGVTITNVKNIDIQQGTLSIETGTTALGDPAYTNIVEAGASLELWNLSSALDKYFVFNGDGVKPTFIAGSQTSSSQNTITPTLGNVTLSGACIFSNGANSTINATVSGTASLTKIGNATNTFGGAVSYAGSTTISNGLLVFNNTKSSGTGITISLAGALGGSGSISGEDVVANGRLIPGDPGNVTGNLNLGGANNLTLNGNTNLFNLRQGGFSSRVSGINNFIVNGTSNNAIQLAVSGGAPLLVNDTFTLFSFNSTAATVSNFVVLPLSGYTFDITNTGTEIDLIVRTAVKSLVWDGNPSGIWDTNTTTADWIWPDGANAHTNFSNGDFVTFDGNGNVRTVNVSSVVAPAAGQQILFNDSNPYTLIGNGSITGAASVFLKNGLTLTIANASNAITGPTIIEFGTLQLGNGGSSGNLGTGPIMATNLAQIGSQFLVFNRSDNNLVVSNAISGLLAVTNIGSGIVTLSAANTFTGGLYVANGTIAAGVNNAVGSGSGVVVTNFGSGPVMFTTNGFVVVSNAASLDGNGRDLGAAPVEAIGAGVVVGGSGQGALVNNSTNAQTQTFRFVTLAGDTTFGGNARWDIRGNPTAALLTDPPGSPYNITKVGSNQVSLVGVTNIDTAISNIDIQAGIFAIQTTTTNVGDPNGTITIHTNAALDVYNLANSLNKKITVQSGGTITNENSTSGIIGAISVTGAATISANNGTTLVLSNNVISGSLTSYTKGGGGAVQLVGNALPTPSTLVDLIGGTLDLSQATSSTLSLPGSQTLRGNGGVNGGISLGAGTTLSPGESSTNFLSLGTITASNSLSSTGLVFLELNLTNSSTVSNDMVAASSITLSGTVTVTNIGPALATGDSFKLFSVAPTGSYTLSPLPSLAAGLSWSNRLAIDGSILVTGSAGPTTNAPILSVRLDNGTNVVIHGTNNNIPNTSFEYVVLTSTNITLPLSNWTSIATNGFNGSGQYDFTNPIAPGKPVLFYDTKAVP